VSRTNELYQDKVAGICEQIEAGTIGREAAVEALGGDRDHAEALFDELSPLPELTVHVGDDYTALMCPGDTTDTALLISAAPSDESIALIRKVASRCNAHSGFLTALTEARALIDGMTGGQEIDDAVGRIDAAIAKAKAA
jgi:hypothetical protein